MTNRTIYVIGQGYNPTPVSIVATLDGNVVYNGTTSTVDENISVTKGPGITELQQQLAASKTALFSFEKDIEYGGIMPLSIQVSDGPVWFGMVVANYVGGRYLNSALSPEQQAIVNNPSSTSAELKQIQFDIANPPFTAEEIAEIQSASYPYPANTQLLVDQHNATLVHTSSGPDGFLNLPDLDGDLDNTWSDVSINGILQPINPDIANPPLNGTWWWTLYPGDVFTGTLRISTGSPS